MPGANAFIPVTDAQAAHFLGQARLGSPKPMITPRVQTLDGYVDAFRALSTPYQMQDAAVAGGMAFLMGELEKRDPKVREPLVSSTWQRDCPVKTGGGFLEYTSTMNVGYSGGGANDELVGGQSNDIPIIQANIGKDIYPLFSKAWLMEVSYIDQAKLQNVGRSLDAMLDGGIRLAWNKALDQNVYLGMTAEGATGIINDPNITVTAAPNGAAVSPLWKNKTPLEIFNDMNSILKASHVASEYDNSGIINHILLPPEQFQLLQQPMTLGGVGGFESILEYFKKNNYAKQQGVDVEVALSRWCKGNGPGDSDVMVGYVNDEDRVYMDITVPLMRVMTQVDARRVAYLTPYVGQFGVVKFLYYQPPQIMSGI